MHFICRSFLGSQSTNHWSLYWENEPDDFSLVSNRGHLFGLISLNGEESDIISLGRQLIDHINRQYYSLSDQTSNCLEHLNQTISSAVNLLPKDISAVIVVSVVHQARLYSACFGAGQIWLKRQQQLAVLIEGQPNKISLSNGPFQFNDSVFLATSSFIEKLNQTDIRRLLSLSSLEALEEGMLSLLYSQTDQSGLAGALIQINHDLEETIPPPVVNSPSNPTPQIYISPISVSQVSKRKKINLLVAVLLLLGLAVSLYFGFQKNQTNRRESKFVEIKNQIDEKIGSAKAVKNLNLDLAMQSAKEADGLLPKLSELNIHQDQVDQLRTEINSLLASTGSSDTNTPQIAYDTSLITDQPHYSKIRLVGNKLYLLDVSTPRFDVVDLKEQSKQKLSEQGLLKDIISFSATSQNVYLATKNTIYLLSNQNIDPKISLSDSEIIDFDIWNSAVYILDDKKRILKYAPNSSGFGKPEEWLKGDSELPPNSVSLAINGKIWIISESGKIESYERGNPTDFSSPQALVISRAKSLSTGIESENLAFTDNEQSVYLIRKNGELQAKYNFEKNKVIDIALDESGSSLFVLSGDQKVYKISL